MSQISIIVRGEPLEGDKTVLVELRVESISFAVSHAFGPNARYKGNDVRSHVTLKPKELGLVVEVREGNTLVDILSAAADQVVLGCEATVELALKREEERLEQLIEPKKTEF